MQAALWRDQRPVWLIREVWGSTGTACSPVICNPRGHTKDSFLLLPGEPCTSVKGWLPRMSHDPGVLSNLKPQMACGITLLGKARLFSFFFFFLEEDWSWQAGQWCTSHPKVPALKHALVNQSLSEIWSLTLCVLCHFLGESTNGTVTQYQQAGSLLYL